MHTMKVYLITVNVGVVFLGIKYFGILIKQPNMWFVLVVLSIQ